MKLKIIAAMAISGLFLSSISFASNPLDNPEAVQAAPSATPTAPAVAVPATPAMPQGPVMAQNQLTENVGGGGDNVALPDSPPSNQVLAQNDFGNMQPSPETQPMPDNMLAQNQNMASAQNDGMPSDIQPQQRASNNGQVSTASPSNNNLSPNATEGVSPDTATGDDDY